MSGDFTAYGGRMNRDSGASGAVLRQRGRRRPEWYPDGVVSRQSISETVRFAVIF